MQPFNNVYSSCILIQIEVYQARKRKFNSIEKVILELHGGVIFSTSYTQKL